MDLDELMQKKAAAAKAAAYEMALVSTVVKNQALQAMADALEKRKELILTANAQDLEDARQ